MKATENNTPKGQPTQGEWKLGEDKHIVKIWSGAKVICELNGCRKEIEANAKVIAASLELLEALKEMNAWVAVNFPEHGMEHEFGTCASFNQMRAAIKKATV